MGVSFIAILREAAPLVTPRRDRITGRHRPLGILTAENAETAEKKAGREWRGDPKTLTSWIC
jgi:hypothetical protein